MLCQHAYVCFVRKKRDETMKTKTEQAANEIEAEMLSRFALMDERLDAIENRLYALERDQRIIKTQLATLQKEVEK